MPLAQLAPLFDLPNVTFINLQKGPGSEQLASSNLSIVDLSGELKDFADTAALVSHLDLVITVDTAVAHLAGALAKATWILLPHQPEWRWLQTRPDSPWYPTVRLFRQPKPGDWPALVAAVREALRTHLAQEARP